MNLVQMKSEEYDLMKQIHDNLGVIEDEEYEYLVNLQEQIENKVQAYLSIVSKDGLLDKEIQRMDELVNDIKAYKERLAKRKKFMEGILYKLAEEKGYLVYDTGVTQYVKPFMKQSRSVEIEQVEDEYGTYILPKLTHDEFKELVSSINNHLLQSYIIAGANHKVNVTDLPEGHRAIKTELIPSIKFVKTKPKE